MRGEVAHQPTTEEEATTTTTATTLTITTEEDTEVTLVEVGIIIEVVVVGIEVVLQGVGMLVGVLHGVEVGLVVLVLRVVGLGK